MTDSDVQQWIEDEKLMSHSSGIRSHSVPCIMQYLAMKQYNKKQVQVQDHGRLRIFRNSKSSMYLGKNDKEL